MRKSSNRSSNRLRERTTPSIPLKTKLGNMDRNTKPQPKRKATKRNYREHDGEEMESEVKMDTREENNPLLSRVLGMFDTLNFGKSKNYHDIINI